MVPSLAGQDRSYLIGQLQALRDKRRRHAAMEGIIAEMADGDIAYMATYYSKQIPMAGKKQLIFKKREKGEPFYKKCRGCHGDRAEGRDGIPRLAGQQAVYLEKTLLAYRAGERSAAGMNESVFALSPEEIKALSRFLSTLR
jgi:cytochrome c553